MKPSDQLTTLPEQKWQKLLPPICSRHCEAWSRPDGQRV
jgi:hypothetical protein